MNENWAAKKLPRDADRLAPSSNTEIRLLPSFPEGEIVHATAFAEKASQPAIIEGFGELFYILEGEGELWRATGELESVTQLTARRCVTIPPGIDYQFRAVRAPMKFLVATAPRFDPKNWHPANRSYWNESGKPASRPSRPGPWTSTELPKRYNYLAPDGSEIRLLPTFDAGGLAHCTLPAGAVSAAVRHRTVKEVWYVLAGRGEVWRGMGGESEVCAVEPDMCLTIPTGVSFQFRALSRSPLEIMIGTFPAWPGPEEAEPVKGEWAVGDYEPRTEASMA
jgi:mannose-6-phosphate isomerase-like protein (cupin superfamily)